ncbi:MAG: hypothetical protein AAF687_00945 [Pseudomonadota bacterium]
MSHLTRIAALAPVALFAMAAPLAAQDKAGDKVNMVIAYDESECPEAGENEIVVCEILVESERYRIPSNLRTSSSPQNESWGSRVESIRYIGEFGTQSCSPAGAGGITGCTEKFIENAYTEKSESEVIRFQQLIEEARQERLSTIDDDASEEQKRVEQIEREYLERLERERAAALPGEERLGPPPSESEAEGPLAEAEGPSL